MSALISPRRTNRLPPSLMLWTFPARAHPPIVAARNRTFAADRIPAASSSVIQSVAAGGIDQSSPGAVFPVEAVLDSVAVVVAAGDAAPSPAALSLGGFSPDAALAAAFVRLALAVDRSFFAHPEPLKWMAGVESAFRIVPSAPHTGQNRGPASLMLWITSVRFRQFAQT